MKKMLQMISYHGNANKNETIMKYENTERQND